MTASSTDYVPPVSTHQVACSTCGNLVDPLRAPGVAHRAGRFRYYCSRACYEDRATVTLTAVDDSPDRRAKHSVPAHDGLDRPSVEEVADMLGLSRASLLPDVRSSLVSGVSSSPSSLRPSRKDLGSWRSSAAPPTATPAFAALALGAIAIVLQQPAWLSDTARTVLTAMAAMGAIVVSGREIWAIRHEGGGVISWSAMLVAPVIYVAMAVRIGTGSTGCSRWFAAAILSAVAAIVSWTARRVLFRVHDELASLGRKLPPTASVVRANGTFLIDASRVRAGEEVRVEHGEWVPVDGIVNAGSGMAVFHSDGGPARNCAEGDSILAGARIVEGSVRILATRAGDDVALSRLDRAWSAANDLPRIAITAERIAQIMPLATLAIGVAGAVFASLSGVRHGWAFAAAAIAAAPCALGAAFSRIPFIEATARAARRGIVFRDGRSMETAARVGSIVLCVRGTVTGARVELVDIVSLGKRSERELLAISAAAEEIAHDHPIARAIISLAKLRNVATESVRRPAPISGRGVIAINGFGDLVAVGSRQLLLDEGISVAPAEDVARTIESQGRTAIFVAIAGKVEGVLGLEDPIREEARAAVQSMMDAGFDLALLAGESRGTVEAIGLALDIVNVRPEVLPDERAAAVRAIAEVANEVAVVGRPKSDGAALGAADVAVSLAAAGATGAETAVALASDDLRDAAAAFQLAHAARRRSIRVVLATTIATLVSSIVCAFVPAVGLLGISLGALSVLAVSLGAVGRRTSV